MRRGSGRGAEGLAAKLRMVRIAAENPFFRDPTFTLLGPRQDLRGTSVNVNDFKIKTDVLKDTTQSTTVGPDVSTPGKSFFFALGDSNLAEARIGSDSVFEVKHGLELLDFGQLPPVERSRAHSQTDHDQSVGTEREDTGQTPVKLDVKLNLDTFQRVALEGTFQGESPKLIPVAFTLPNMISARSPGKNHIDIFG